MGENEDRENLSRGWPPPGWSNEDIRYLTHQVAQEAARETAERTVHETLDRLGIDVHDPRSAQRDFIHLHKQRRRADEVDRWVKIVLTAAGLFGAVSMVYWLIEASHKIGKYF